jgi:hypothetical protein
MAKPNDAEKLGSVFGVHLQNKIRSKREKSILLTVWTFLLLRARRLRLVLAKTGTLRDSQVKDAR